MKNVRKQSIRNTYNIIYNPSVYDVHNTHSFQTSIRSRIKEHKTINLLHDVDQRLLEWEINKEKMESQESCPVCYEPIQSNNYIVPKCGHKLCLHCYKKCVLSRGDCANKCCLCRVQIL